MRHGCTFSLRTYSDGLTKFRILFSLNVINENSSSVKQNY